MRYRAWTVFDGLPLIIDLHLGAIVSISA